MAPTYLRLSVHRKVLAYGTFSTFLARPFSEYFHPRITRHHNLLQDLPRVFLSKLVARGGCTLYLAPLSLLFSRLVRDLSCLLRDPSSTSRCSSVARALCCPQRDEGSLPSNGFPRRWHSYWRRRQSQIEFACLSPDSRSQPRR